MFSGNDRIPACDGRTDGQTSCDGIVRAVHTRRAVMKQMLLHSYRQLNKHFDAKHAIALCHVVDGSFHGNVGIFTGSNLKRNPGLKPQNIIFSERYVGILNVSLQRLHFHPSVRPSVSLSRSCVYSA